MKFDYPATQRVLDEVCVERRRQHDKWGQQDHPDAPPRNEEDLVNLQALADVMRDHCDAAAREGDLTYSHIAAEEYAEAMLEAARGDEVALRAELVQCAAVFVAWIETIDRRRSSHG